MKGSPNLGNTCYFNSAIQCLLQVPVFSNHLILKGYHGECEFTRELSHVTKDLWVDKSSKVTNFQKLLQLFQNNCSQFKNFFQHDVQEAFIYILDIVEKSIPHLVKENFYMKVKKEVTYPGGKSETFEEMLVNFLYPKPEHETIKDVIDDMYKWSTIRDYEDDHGNKHLIAGTRTIFETFPKVLVFSLGCKHFMTLTETLELQDVTYKLISTAVHIGNEHKGHYVSFGRHKGKWYLKDDDVITEHDIPLKAAHYLILYYRIH